MLGFALKEQNSCLFRSKQSVNWKSPLDEAELLQNKIAAKLRQEESEIKSGGKSDSSLGPAGNNNLYILDVDAEEDHRISGQCNQGGRNINMNIMKD